ncbi:MAG: putative NOP5 family protein [Euryarchaeota archaeon ADurb.Bin294]|nr:RNA-processing protein [Methanospirillum sp.]MBP9009343.1 RNA-processing protein [Methanospirillum sp.]OQA55291.1 MAG: putative NOP5 family protein [Euryarchaeota archaeon ADurb.Bin294]
MAKNQVNRAFQYWYEALQQGPADFLTPTVSSMADIIDNIQESRDNSELLPLPAWEEAVSAGFVPDRNGYLSLLRDVAIGLTIRDLEKRCDKDEAALIHLIRILDEIDQSISRLSEKIEDYYIALHPAGLSGNERNISSLIESLAKDQTHPLSHLAGNIQRVRESRTLISQHVRDYATKSLPNMSALCGPLVSARLLAGAGSKHHLAGMPAASFQVLGAGPSLFMHLTSGTNPPKHGIIYQYKGVHHAKRRVRGRVSRVLACQLAIAARIDYFRGVPDDEFIRKAGEKIYRAGKPE